MARPLRSLLPLLLPLLGATLAAQEPLDSYEVGPSDVLSVVVLGQDGMTGAFAVDPDGMLTFPILGKLKASEMTPREFERKLTTLLADGYLRQPQVSVSVKEYRSQKVFVTGEVSRPGPTALKGDRSLLALIADVGGFTAGAGHEVIVIRPPQEGAAAPPPLTPSLELPVSDAGAEALDGGDTQPPPLPDAPDPALVPSDLPGADIPGAEVFRVGRRALEAGSPEANLLLKIGDRVYVPKAAQVYITGRVQRPGSYRYAEGMTVLQALTLAGGVTERGSSGRVKVIRVVGAARQELKVKMTELVEPEDTIVVPERFF